MAYTIVAPGGQPHTQVPTAMTFQTADLVLQTEPGEGNKPQPLGNFGLIFIFTTSTLCLLYLLWRRASALRAVVSHQCDH